MILINCCHFVEQNTMMLPNTSFWYATDLSGKPVDNILAEFIFNEEGTKVLRCPARYGPRSCSYTEEKSQQFHISFQRDLYVESQ